MFFKSRDKACIHSWNSLRCGAANVENVETICLFLQHELKDLVEKAGGKLATRLKEGELFAWNQSNNCSGL